MEKQIRESIELQAIQLVTSSAETLKDDIKYSRYFELSNTVFSLYNSSVNYRDNDVFNIKEVVLLDTENRILAHSHPLENQLLTPYLKKNRESEKFENNLGNIEFSWMNKQELLMIKKEIYLDNELLGYLYVDIEPKYLKSARIQHLEEFFVIVILFVSGLVAFLLIFGRWVEKPVEIINSELKKIGTGNISFDLLQNKNDEILQLTESIVQADRRIHEQQIELEKQKMLLKKEVTEKTKDLKQQTIEIETIFESSKDGISVLDLESNFVKVNKAYIDITGYTEEELLQKSCIGMSIPEDVPRANKAIEMVHRKGFIENFEKSCYRKDGSIFTINMSIAMMPDKKHLLITTKDITESIILRNELISAKEKAEMTSRFKSEFLANMSHEIRTPMNGILGFVNHLQKSEKDPGRIKEFNLIRSSGNTLLHIINDILDFSKIESGKMEVESHTYSIYETISETTGVFSEIIGDKKIGFSKNIDETIPACLMGDPVRVKQVIFNLLSNAIKFTPENGNIALDAKYLKATDQVQISVTDTGIGIPKDKLEKIFEAFSQQDTSTTRKYGGTGLGLNISTRLIEKMGGKLQVESEVKKGSRFYFELPVVACSESEIEKEDSGEAATTVQFSAHALIVEDNKTNQMLLSMILDDLGLSYDIANDGVEGLKCVIDNKYDIILMDENMPNMNGLEATNQIRLMEHDNEDIQIPIIAVTANALTEDRQRFLDAGMDDYIAKPYTEEDIINMLQKYLG